MNQIQKNAKEELVVDVITASKTQFEKEESDLVKVILNERFFKPWRELNNTIVPDSKSLASEAYLELFLTSTCNQNCEYCYLQKHDALYPHEFNKKSLVLKNLSILLDWIESSNFRLPKLDIFTGEIWHESYGLEVLELLYQSLCKKQWTVQIGIPSNCSFVRDEIQLAKIQRYIDKFNKIGVRLWFSISVDGAIVENNIRPLKDNTYKTDEFYERLFLFAMHNEFGFHPMIAANSVDKWIENFQWWEQMCEKYETSADQVMLLEVRNDEWTEDKIEHYKKFLDFLINRYKEKHCVDNNDFFKQILGLAHNELYGYNPMVIGAAGNFATCSIPQTLTVRLGDMAICPCHRTAYNKYLYGHFKIENDKIVDIIGNNPQMAIRVLLTNNTAGHLQCDVCPYEYVCLKGCFGAQYEVEGDPFIPIAGVCHFFEEKYSFLVDKYIEMGIIPFLESFTPYYDKYTQIQELLKFIKGVKAAHGKVAKH